MPDNTDSYVEVADYIKALLEASRVELGLAGVWYGDQQLVPQVPAACVEPGTMSRVLAGVSNRTENNITVFVFVYHAGIQDTQVTKHDCDKAAELIIAKLHSDTKMGGKVIFGHCTTVEPGYATRGGELMFATRITWEGITKTGVGT